MWISPVNVTMQWLTGTSSPESMCFFPVKYGVSTVNVPFNKFWDGCCRQICKKYVGLPRLGMP